MKEKYMAYCDKYLISLDNDTHYKIDTKGNKKPLSVWNNKNGEYAYKQININNKSVFVHRVVWESVYGSIPKGMVIDHIDNDRLNNNISNLQLLTRAENTKKSWYSSNRKSQMKSVVVAELDMEFESINECARHFIKIGVSKSTNEKKVATRISKCLLEHKKAYGLNIATRGANND